MVKTYDSRYKLLQEPNVYSFLDLKINPVWDASVYYRTERVSEDGGLTYKEIKS
jgi:hypothetical protein